MARKKKQTWKPAKSFTVTKLPPSGPKAGQSVDRWVYGKTKRHEETMDNPRNKFSDLP
tara:strand:+ start:143 stop:316 length:174 start_codon:yes stop_codon:yes gene_type:complete